MTTKSAKYLSTLHKQIDQHFNFEDVKTLCLDLGVDHENVPGNIRSAFIRNLLVSLARQNRLNELIDLVQRKRPNADWPDLPADFALPTTIAQENLQQVEQYQVYGDYVHGDKVGGDKVLGDKITAGAIGQVGDRYEIAQAQIVMPQVFAEALMGFLSDEQSPDYSELKGRESWEPETVLVEAGTFLMGSKRGEGIPEQETPQFEMILPAYRIGKYPVTNAQYYHFIRETKRTAPTELGWQSGNAPAKEQYDLPVRGVTWYGALAYCHWLMKMTKRPYTLPSEAQWEKAARGDEGNIFPWGDTWRADHCNTECDRVTAVDAFPDGVSPYGCRDMVGNVREWTTTLWGRNRKYNLELESPYPWENTWKPHEGQDRIDGNRQIRRVTRGGAALLPQIPLRAARRKSERPYNRGLKASRVGFRVALNWETIT